MLAEKTGLGDQGWRTATIPLHVDKTTGNWKDETGINMKRGAGKSRIDNETNCVGTGIIKVAVGSRRATGSIFDRRILEREGTERNG